MTVSRRNFLGGFGCCCCLSMLATGCVSPSVDRIEAGYLPAVDTDEAGLWQMSDDIERDVAASPTRIREAGLEPYLHEVVCRLGARHCPDIRVYLAHAPYFNASMLPNGAMQVWSGLLLRAENEAQLAAVLGHEMGHYLERHTLERWRRINSSLATAQWLGLGIWVAGGGGLDVVPTLIAIADAFAYSRDQEREADAIGFDLMTSAGYAPMAASQLWGNLIEETSADPHRDEPGIFLTTHPAAKERRKTLQTLAEKVIDPSTETGEVRYRQTIRTLRSRLLADEVGLRRPEPSLVLMARLRRSEPDSGDLAFYEGEVYRLRGESGDIDRALSLYEEAVAIGHAPSETWRAIGLVHRRQGRNDRAAEAFGRYLELEPNAPDAELIRAYMLQTSSH